MPTMYCLSSCSVRSRSGMCTLASMTMATRDSSGLVTRISGWNAIVPSVCTLSGLLLLKQVEPGISRQGSTLQLDSDSENSAQILWDADTGDRMSFRNEGSCRIDDPEVFENFGAYPRLQSAFGNQIDPA